MATAYGVRVANLSVETSPIRGGYSLGRGDHYHSPRLSEFQHTRFRANSDIRRESATLNRLCAFDKQGSFQDCIAKQFSIKWFFYFRAGPVRLIYSNRS